MLQIIGSPQQQHKKTAANDDGSSSDSESSTKSTITVSPRKMRQSLASIGKKLRSFRSSKPQERQVRFATATKVYQIPNREDLDRQELFWKPSEMTQGRDVDFEDCRNYLAASDHFFHNICNAKAMPDEVLAHVAVGLNKGFRGLERATEMGQYRRNMSRAIVKRVVAESKDGDSCEDLGFLMASLTERSRVFAQASAQADAAVVCID